MADTIPPRFHWALDRLAVRPDERLLEIGCGTGVLLALVAERLTAGWVTGLDRSDKAIAQATRRNAAAIAACKVSLVTASFADAAFEPAAFDRIFAFNVNVFWLNPAREVAAAQRLLKPGGSLLLFYDPPSAAQVEAIVTKLRGNLERGGFELRDVACADVGGTAVLAVAAVRHSASA